MTRFARYLHKRHTSAHHKQAGMVTLTEVMVASVMTAMVVGASSLGLRTTGSLISHSGDKATLRQNTVNGLRLMRSEIERSIHLVLNNSGGFPADRQHLNLSDPRYADTLSRCANLAGGRAFVPMVGTKMVELTNPVIYGVSTNGNGYGYSIVRCGAPLKLDGRYNETEELFISTILEDIGSIPCEGDDCPGQQNLSSYLSPELFTFSGGFTPVRSVHEPAVRIETDSSYKLVKLVDPTADGDDIEASYLEKRNNSKTITKQNLYFAAFARADKHIDNVDNGLEGGILSGAFFQNITSDKVRFVVDGSGSMSACVMWGEGYGEWRKFYQPGQGYINTNRNCAFTRMESLQKELAVLLEQLPDDTRIGLRSFSSSGYANHKTWDDYGTNLVRLGNSGVRESATEFVYTLDDRSPTRWGGTNPWEAIQAAFDDPETDALYFLSDGKPNRDPYGGYWGSSDESPTATYYSDLNEDREVNLKVHTTALGLESLWMEQLAELTGGAYNQVDSESLGEASSS